MTGPVEHPPALPVRSSLRSSRLLEPTTADAKKSSLDDAPPLSPAIPPHDVYLSSEEDASSSADDFSDYDDLDFDDLDSDCDVRRDSHEDTARVVSIVFHGKPSIVQMPARSMTAPSLTSLQRSDDDEETDPRAPKRKARPSTIIAPSYSTPAVPSFLNTDPFASRPGSSQSHRHNFRQAVETNQSSKVASSMLKRTLSLARKRSSSTLNQNVAQSEETLSADEAEKQETAPASKMTKAPSRMSRRASTIAEGASERIERDRPPTPRFAKGHSRLRSSLSISMGRRKQ